ncbi:halogenation protein CepH [Actinacidiphila yanglinensis]|uniref:Halogenation protein CepH n=1 Tax=Actinacidiphila yanglinensis TaxID=310779 RepID=A0A1H6C6F4_9ACTN|nr:tryptophan 7-halogenase [Actinacidiphila yanglinensis]SEG68580.1 halogenation protein CepH [Actinacidiphila yanglinensis]
MNQPDRESTDVDVVVVGGGPAGSTVASFVAKQGGRVLLLEKETFPRYQIGESLLPSTTQWICGLLGVADEVEAAGFQTKTGGTFLWGASPKPWSFTFATASHRGRHAFQVERMKFDKILLDNARRLGVDVREQCAVKDVVSDPDRVRGVTYTDAGGAEHTVTARFVVDASGNSSRIRRHVGGTRELAEYFRNIAVFGYFEGGKRMDPPLRGNILCAAFGGGWFWYIPLTDELTSVGAVVPADMVDKIQQDREAALTQFIGESPMISDFLTDARRVTEGPYGEVRVRKDYSYSNTRFWRPGMALVGDAACFVDPLFSTGVYLATYSGLLAARSINSVLAGQVEEQRAFAEAEFRHRREYNLYYEFLKAVYDTHQDETSYFWTAKKLTGGTASEADSFSYLTAGLGAGEYTPVDGGPGAPDAAARSRGRGPDEDAAMRAFWQGRTEEFTTEHHPDPNHLRLDDGNHQRLLRTIEEGWRARPDRLTVSGDSMYWQEPEPEPEPETAISAPAPGAG